MNERNRVATVCNMVNRARLLEKKMLLLICHFHSQKVLKAMLLIVIWAIYAHLNENRQTVIFFLKTVSNIFSVD